MKATTLKQHHVPQSGDYCVCEVHFPAIEVRSIRNFDLSLEAANKKIAALKEKFTDKEFMAIPIQSLR